MRNWRMIEISFPDKSIHDAGSLAQRLRTAMIEERVPATTIALRKSTSATMDVGSLLEFDWAAILHGTHVAVTTIGTMIGIIKAISNVCAPTGASVRLSNNDRSIVIDVSKDRDPNELLELLKALLKS
jgi:hypothetical protein